jgi:tRNA 2-thiouridine synthesizing protein A
MGHYVSDIKDPYGKRITTMNTTIEANIVVDATGLRCPEPLMVVRNKMMDMDSGQIIKVIATDPSTSWDFPKFCNFLNHELIHHEESKNQYLYWIKKG